jgi:hypothetical protein
MFDERHRQIDSAYTETLRSAVDISKELAKILVELTKALGGFIKDKLNEKEEKDKIAVKVGDEIFNLVEDKDIPGTYKWEKVDLTKGNEQSTDNEREISTKNSREAEFDDKDSNLVQDKPEIEKPFTEYQAQTLARRLISDKPNDSVDYESAKTPDPAIKITIVTLDGEKVLYEQNNEGKCIKNTFTEELSEEEIIDVAYEPLNQILPPDSTLYEPGQGKLEAKISPDKEVMSSSAEDMLLQVVNDNEITTDSIKIESANYIPEENEEYVVSFTGDVDISNPPEFDNPPEEKTILDNVYVAGVLAGISTSAGRVINDASLEAIEEVLHEEFKDEYPIFPAKVVTGTAVTQDLNVTATTTLGEVPGGIVEPATFIGGMVASEVIVNTTVEEEKRDAEKGTIEERIEARVNDKLSGNKTVGYPENENEEAESRAIIKKELPVEEEEAQAKSKKARNILEDEPVANYTYQEVANSPGVEPAEQQWARQVEVPIYEIKNKKAREERFNGENKEITETATAMLKKYGTVEQDGSRIYRSDAFVIRQEGDKVSIHRRNDELSEWKNSLMEYKLNKNEEPKITKKPTEMLPVERQEFLMVSEKLNENGKLPDLGTDDVRDIGNNLGSLAPAGTIKTLKEFKQSEMLSTLNNVLTQTGKDELTVGEFTIKRSLSENNTKATFQVFKNTEEKGNRELLKFDLKKDEKGNVTQEVSKMNISDYDINQIKFIAQNAQKLNIEQIFGKEQSPVADTDATAAANTPKEKLVRTVGDIPVKVHPYIAQEWANMVKDGSPEWEGAMKQDNEEILQRIKDNDGKLPIAEQREMYSKIVTYKTGEAQKQGENAMEFVPLKEVMKDLSSWRKDEIKQQFTPTENIPNRQRETVAATAPKAKYKGMEL